MSFEPRSVTAFRYAAARFDAATAVAEFDFELIGEGEPLRFTESITFTTGPAAPVLSAEDAERLQRVLALLGAVLGLSYFKAAAPPRVELDVAGLTAEAVEYLRQVLRHGLAEFAYRAGLPSLLDLDIVAADLAPALPIRDAEGAPFAIYALFDRVDHPARGRHGGADGVAAQDWKPKQKQAEVLASRKAGGAAAVPASSDGAAAPRAAAAAARARPRRGSP